jgi:hypothetical protein
MDTIKLSKIYNHIENHFLYNSRDTDDFLNKMKSVDEFFNNFDQIGKGLKESIKQINVDEFCIKDKHIFSFTFFGYTFKLFKS